MNTRFWGPSGWKLLHSITAIYPKRPNLKDKIILKEFMEIVSDILPCKYCRASFTKYSQSLPIDTFLNNNDRVQEWLYKMHNKVNGKLRRQGFCTLENPTFEDVKIKYKRMTINSLDFIIKKIDTERLTPEDGMLEMIQFICNLGYDFLGSVIFNYQGYFVNCHTSEEKTKIVSNYHKFFNILPEIIFQYMYPTFFDKDQMQVYRKVYSKLKLNVREILLQNEPYSKLKKWFYECELLCGDKPRFANIEEYENHFGKHIVSTCNNADADKIKSCRKLTKKDTKNYSRIHKSHNT